MPGRPYAAALTIRCLAPGCECERVVDAFLFEAPDNTQLLERKYEKDCLQCGHSPGRHSTLNIEKRGTVERRTQPRK